MMPDFQFTQDQVPIAILQIMLLLGGTVFLLLFSGLMKFETMLQVFALVFVVVLFLFGLK